MASEIEAQLYNASSQMIIANRYEVTETTFFNRLKKQHRKKRGKSMILVPETAK